MKRLMLTTLFIALFSIACGDNGSDDNTADTGNTADSGDTTDTGNTGNTGDSGDTTDTGNTGNTGDSGNTADTEDTGNTGDSGNIADTGDTTDTGNSGNSGDSANTGDTSDTGNTADSADTGDSGDSGNTGDTGEACGGNFPHEHDGLCWSEKAPDHNMDHADAISYCEGLGGDLPTISELRTLIQNCPNTETGGACGVTDSCLSYSDCRNVACDGCSYDPSGKYSVYGDVGWFWSSSVQSDNTEYVWNVFFANGGVNGSRLGDSRSVRCVR